MTLMQSILGRLQEGGVNTEGLEDVILKDAALATTTSGGVTLLANFVPIISGPAMATSTVVACTTFVWHMYISLARKLGVSWDSSFLKALACAALTNLAANVFSLLGGSIIVGCLPGCATIVGISLTFCTVYAAGVMFLVMLSRLMKKYGSLASIPSEFDTSVITQDKRFFKSIKEEAENARS